MLKSVDVTPVRRVKGRGASTFHRSEKEMDDMRMSEDVAPVVDAQKSQDEEVSHPYHLQLATSYKYTHNFQPEDIADDVITCPTMFDWTPYGAELIRAEEAKNGRQQSKSYCDLSSIKRGMCLVVECHFRLVVRLSGCRWE